MNHTYRFRLQRGRGAALPGLHQPGCRRIPDAIERLAAILFSVPLCLGWVTAAAAQQPGTPALPTLEGLVVGLDVGGAVVGFDNQPPDRAGIVGLRAGYGLNPILTPYLGIYEADVDNLAFDAFDKVTLGHVDLGVRLHLPNDARRWVLFGDLALTFWPVSDVLKNGERTAGGFSGAAVSLGGGLAVYISETWALDVNGKWGTGEFEGISIGDATTGGLDRLDVGAASARFTVGFSWWP